MAGLVLDEHGHDDVSWLRKEVGGILPHPTKLLLLVLQWRCLRSIENTEFLPHPDRNVFGHKKSDRCMAVPGHDARRRGRDHSRTSWAGNQQQYYRERTGIASKTER